MKSINRTVAAHFGQKTGSSIALLVAAGAMIALVAGCGGGGGGGGGGAAPAQTVDLTGTVTSNGNPLTNMYVYVQGSSPLASTTTNSSGQYTLPIQGNQTVTLGIAPEYSGTSCTESEVIAQNGTLATTSVTVGSATTQTDNITVSASTSPPSLPSCALQ